MTRIIIWRDDDRSSVRLASDSRLSGPTSPLTDNASKLLAMPISLRHRWEDENGGPPRQREIYEADMAFAFAGSALAATSTFSYVSSVSRRLVAWEWEGRLSAQDFAQFVARVGTRYAREIGQTSRNAAFEAALVMADPEPQQGEGRDVRTFYLRQDPSLDRFALQAFEYNIVKGKTCLVLGDNRRQAKSALALGFDRDPNFNPLTWLSQEIEDPDISSIDGRIHQAHVSETGLTIRPIRLLCEHGHRISTDSTNRIGAFKFSSGQSGDW